MTICMKCWSDAELDALGGGDICDHYRRLLRERASNPCTPEEQAGSTEGAGDAKED